MKNIMKWLLPAILLTTVNAQVPAPKTINLWPGTAPGSEAWKQPETTVGNPGNRRIMNVSTPTLTAYLPDPSTATGTAVIIAPGGGFVWLSIDSEGHDVAKWLAARGIAGIVHVDGSTISAADLMRMNRAVAHRGPDDEGYVLINSRLNQSRIFRAE